MKVFREDTMEKDEELSTESINFNGRGTGQAKRTNVIEN